MKRGWLKKAVEAAQKEKASWPQWMRDASHFEGRNYDDDREDKDVFRGGRDV